MDRGSGIATLTCGGAAAVITGQSYTCDVAVSTGTTVVTIQATDTAGWTATQSASIVVGAPPEPTSLAINLATLMIAEETRRLQ